MPNHKEEKLPSSLTSSVIVETFKHAAPVCDVQVFCLHQLMGNTCCHITDLRVVAKSGANT